MKVTLKYYPATYVVDWPYNGTWALKVSFKYNGVLMLFRCKPTSRQIRKAIKRAKGITRNMVIL